MVKQSAQYDSAIMTTLSFMVVPQTCGSKNPGASSDDIWRNT